MPDLVWLHSLSSDPPYHGSVFSNTNRRIDLRMDATRWHQLFRFRSLLSHTAQNGGSVLSVVGSKASQQMSRVTLVSTKDSFQRSFLSESLVFSKLRRVPGHTTPHLTSVRPLTRRVRYWKQESGKHRSCTDSKCWKYITKFGVQTRIQSKYIFVLRSLSESGDLGVFFIESLQVRKMLMKHLLDVKSWLACP